MNILNILSEKAYAAGIDAMQDPIAGSFPSSSGSTRSVLFSMMSYVLNLIPVLLGALAFFAIVYSAVLYLMAMGDPGKMEVAKKNITWIVMGVVIVAVTLIVIKVIVNIVGLASS